MGDTSKLLKLYRVDQQLRGLTSRLKTASTYLEEQERKLERIAEQMQSLASQQRQLEAAAHNDETELKAADQRIELLRERMNNASTSKEHSALLVEINTIKADRSSLEERALDSLGKVDAIKEQLAKLEAEREQVEKVKMVATKDRDEKAAEIKDRLAELETERETVVKDVPASALGIYNERLERGVEEVMAAIEEQDRRNMEYICSACYTHVPVELLNRLLNRVGIVTCPSCRTILYVEQDLSTSIADSNEKRRKKRAVAD